MLTTAEQDALWRAIDRAPGPAAKSVILSEYERMTGFVETNPNAVLHHMAAFYGPPCRHCRKPLRTPKAKFCAACGQDRSD